MGFAALYHTLDRSRRTRRRHLARSYTGPRQASKHRDASGTCRVSVCTPRPPLNVHTQVAKAPTDALYTLESTTTAVVAAIVTAQSASFLPGGTLSLDVPTSTPETPLTPRITLPERYLTLSELSRLKRQFVTIHKRAITLGTTEKGKVDWSQESVALKFVAYLEENVGLKP